MAGQEEMQLMDIQMPTDFDSFNLSQNNSILEQGNVSLSRSGGRRPGLGSATLDIRDDPSCRVRKLVRLCSNSSSSGCLSASSTLLGGSATSRTNDSLRDCVGLDEIEMPSFVSDSTANTSQALLVSLSPSATPSADTPRRLKSGGVGATGPVGCAGATPLSRPYFNRHDAGGARFMNRPAHLNNIMNTTMPGLGSPINNSYDIINISNINTSLGIVYDNSNQTPPTGNYVAYIGGEFSIKSTNNDHSTGDKNTKLHESQNSHLAFSQSGGNVRTIIGNTTVDVDCKEVNGFLNNLDLTSQPGNKVQNLDNTQSLNLKVNISKDITCDSNNDNTATKVNNGGPHPRAGGVADLPTGVQCIGIKGAQKASPFAGDTPEPNTPVFDGNFAAEAATIMKELEAVEMDEVSLFGDCSNSSLLDPQVLMDNNLFSTDDPAEPYTALGAQPKVVDSCSEWLNKLALDPPASREGDDVDQLRLHEGMGATCTQEDLCQSSGREAGHQIGDSDARVPTTCPDIRKALLFDTKQKTSVKFGPISVIPNMPLLVTDPFERLHELVGETNYPGKYPEKQVIGNVNCTFEACNATQDATFELCTTGPGVNTTFETAAQPAKINTTFDGCSNKTAAQPAKINTTFDGCSNKTKADGYCEVGRPLSDDANTTFGAVPEHLKMYNLGNQKPANATFDRGNGKVVNTTFDHCDNNVHNTTLGQFNGNPANTTFEPCNIKGANTTFDHGNEKAANTTFDQLNGKAVNATFQHSNAKGANSTFDQCNGRAVNTTFDLENVKANTTFDHGNGKVANTTFDHGNGKVANTTFDHGNGKVANTTFDHGNGKVANTTFDHGNGRAANTTFDQADIETKRINTTFDERLCKHDGSFYPETKYNSTFCQQPQDTGAKAISPSNARLGSPITGPGDCKHVGASFVVASGRAEVGHKDRSVVRRRSSYSHLNRSASMPCSPPDEELLNASIHQMCKNQSYSCINLMDADYSEIKHILKMPVDQQAELRLLCGSPARQKNMSFNKRRSLPNNTLTTDFGVGTPNKSVLKNATSHETLSNEDQSVSNITTSTPKPVKSVQEILNLYKQPTPSAKRPAGDAGGAGGPKVDGGNDTRQPKIITQILSKYQQPLAGLPHQQQKLDAGLPAHDSDAAAGGVDALSNAVATLPPAPHDSTTKLWRPKPPVGGVVATSGPLRALHPQHPSSVDRGAPHPGPAASTPDNGEGPDGCPATEPAEPHSVARSGRPLLPSFGSFSSIDSERPCSPDAVLSGKTFACTLDSPLPNGSGQHGCRTSTPASRVGGAAPGPSPLHNGPTPIAVHPLQMQRLPSAGSDPGTPANGGGGSSTLKKNLLKQQKLRLQQQQHQQQYSTPPLQQISERCELATMAHGDATHGTADSADMMAAIAQLQKPLQYDTPPPDGPPVHQDAPLSGMPCGEATGQVVAQLPGVQPQNPTGKLQCDTENRSTGLQSTEAVQNLYSDQLKFVVEPNNETLLVVTENGYIGNTQTRAAGDQTYDGNLHVDDKEDTDSNIKNEGNINEYLQNPSNLNSTFNSHTEDGRPSKEMNQKV